ncbi:MAG: hypothetical protein HC824_05805 [Synechococcales cyanobacterium RM1_1_8]|nr:hypothetical protein [Synechococcales cyanobacterium RM1_1_8]
MNVNLKLLLGALVLAASSAAMAPASAQQFPSEGSWAETLDDAFNGSGNIYDSQTTVGNLRTLYGTGSGLFRRGNYPEIAIERDSEQIERAYRTMMYQQVASDPDIRVVDLPNPFESSLLVEPSIFSRQSAGTELVNERSPF